MSEFGPGPEFLKQKYELYKAEEVDRSVNSVEREKGIKINTPEEKISTYLDRIESFFNDPDPEKRARKTSLLKHRLFNLLVTKPEEISQNYAAFVEEVIEERGQLGDWESASEEERQNIILEQEDALLSDQRDSLENWIDYLSSSDAMYPTWLKYWAFRSISNLKEYDKEKECFSKRSKGTVKMFPDLNYEALSYVLDAVEKKYKKEAIDIPYDIQEDEKSRFDQFLKNENFASLYAWAIENINPIDEELLQVTEGKWVKFDQGTDPMTYIPDEAKDFASPLIKSIRGKGTGWCTAGETSAKKQMKEGDFYVFYSNDEQSNPTIPRIAIRMEKGKIAEVRGVASKQNLDPYMGEVLTKKLQEFPDKDEYLKKEQDMAQLTLIKNKTQKGEDLKKEDLEFLYEVKSKIQGFGYKADPRIKRLREPRNLEADLAVLLDCQLSQIAKSQEDVENNAKTGIKIKAYIGKLYPGILTQLYNLEHVYTTFPEGKITYSELEIGGKTAIELEQELKDNNIYTTSFAKSMLHSPSFTILPNPKQYKTVRLKVKDLGFTSGATTDQIYAKAQEFGLELCPAEVGPYQRLKDENQSLNDWYIVAMKQILDRDGDPDVFRFSRFGDGLWLDHIWASSDAEWDADQGILFGLPQVSPKS